MLATKEVSSPLLPITSLQDHYFHALTNSFAQRRGAIPFVISDFQTLFIATGVVPSFVYTQRDGPKVDAAKAEKKRAWTLIRFIHGPRLMLYIAIQCSETPFRERFGAIPPTPVD
jgi:hypothetical protein